MIAVDAMGGDFAPQIAVKGAYMAAKKGVKIALFGQQTMITDLLEQLDLNWQRFDISIVHCSETISMAEEPSRAIFKKKDSSLLRAMQAVAKQEADAFVSAGHSGAILVSAIMSVGKVQGVLRPALASFIPTLKGSILCLDLGANTDCRPDFLRQFALMGHEYVRQIKKIERPRIAVLSNGSERYKGNQLTRDVFQMLESSGLNFMGNLESKEVFHDYADVLVCDGFAGNVMLKSAQGAAFAIKYWLSQEYNQNWMTKILGLLNKPIFKRLQKKIDYTQYGGALLLGVNAPVVVAHGASNEYALENAILLAEASVKNATITRFNYGLSELLKDESVNEEPREINPIKKEESTYISS